MKKKKGSLLIAITLLSVVLLIILMTIFNLNKKDAELIAIKGDREKSFQSSNIGLKMATRDIEKKINEALEKDKSMTWNDLYSLSHKIDKEKVDNYNDEYEYKYDYAHGKITAIGTYRSSRTFGEKGNNNDNKDSTERVYSTTTLTANYLMDYVGISAKNIVAENSKDGISSNMGFKAVYSYDTQYPMKPWINIYDDNNSKNLAQQGDVKNNALNNARDLISNGYITQIPEPVGLYSFIDNFSSSSSSSNKKINSLDKMFNMCCALDLKSSNGKLFTDNVKYRSWMTFSIKSLISKSKRAKGPTWSYIYDKVENVLSNLFGDIGDALNNNELKIFTKQLKVGVKVYRTLGGYLSNNTYRGKVIKKLGVKEDQIAHCLDRVVTKNEKDKYSLYKFNYNSAEISKNNSIKKVYRLAGRNVILIPLNATVIIDGDLILEPEEKYEDYYKTVYDLKDLTNVDEKYTPNEVNKKSIPESYPVLLVTGNLVVNGSIKGVGTVMSMKNIIINNFPYDINDYRFKPDCEKYKEYYKNPEKGAIIVHANGRMAVNSCDVNQLLSQVELSRLQTSRNGIIEEEINKNDFLFNTYDRKKLNNSEEFVNVDEGKSDTYADRNNTDGYQIILEEDFDESDAEEIDKTSRLTWLLSCVDAESDTTFTSSGNYSFDSWENALIRGVRDGVIKVRDGVIEGGGVTVEVDSLPENERNRVIKIFGTKILKKPADGEEHLDDNGDVVTNPRPYNKDGE